jgi:hypothetical protein
MRGNLCENGVVRLGARSRDGLDRFDKKIYLAIYFLGTKDLQSDLMTPEGALERLKRKVSREDLYGTFVLNWRLGKSNGGGHEDLSEWNKPKLWNYLVNEKLLRAMIVVAGAGPHASGMPELQLAMSPANAISGTCVLVTDGRVSWQHDGISIAHVVPEAVDGGGLAAVRTGDWIYLDLSRGEFQVVKQSNRQHGYKVLSPKDLLHRPDCRRRIHELERLRGDLLPSFRILLDQVSSAEDGVSPVPKN